MSGDPGARPLTDAGHLDEDPEALEDPVHRGDAEHQHELHHHQRDGDDTDDTDDIDTPAAGSDAGPSD